MSIAPGEECVDPETTALAAIVRDLLGEVERLTDSGRRLAQLLEDHLRQTAAAAGMADHPLAQNADFVLETIAMTTQRFDDARGAVSRVQKLAADYSAGPYPMFAQEIRRALNGGTAP